VYIFILPGGGIISELLPVFVRSLYLATNGGDVLYGNCPGGLPGLGSPYVHRAWKDYLRVPFMYSTLLVAVPTGIKFFSWVATMWQGRIRLQVPMLFLLGAIIVFLMGG
jgi:cytochrome c oxidase subunit 1